MSPEAEQPRPGAPLERGLPATACELLPGRTSGAASLGWAGAGVAVALAAAFAITGVWQAWALVDGAREVTRDIDVAKARGPAPLEPRTRSPSAARAAGKAADVPSVPLALVSTSRGELDGNSAVSDPLIGTAANVLQPTAVARAFEALAEATERAIPVGSGALLDDVVLDDAVLGDPEGVLTLGQPPPPGYPRVACEDIFVYIVTLVEEAPRSSSASIGVGETGPARFRRPGQTVGAWTLLALDDDWSGLEPRAWLVKDGAACRAKLAGNPTRTHRVPKPAAARQPTTRERARQTTTREQARQPTKSAARAKTRRR